MVTKELSEAAVEFNCILENSSKTIIEKIPSKFLEFIRNIESKTYRFSYDKSKCLKEQNLKPETRGLIALVYEKYICNDDERREYIKQCKTVMIEQERLKREKYNPNDLFNKEDKNAIQKSKKEVQIEVSKKENFLQKMIQKVKKLFKKYN
jgi:hypothetical protein